MPSVAVPDVLSATVTFSCVAPDNVAVNVSDDPAFSAIDVALVESVNVGADSFSVIVIVTVCGVPCSATPDFPETPLIAMVAVSLPS